MIIRELNNYEDKPLSLLLSADPSQNSINDCVERGTCFVAEEQKKIIGVFVLLSTRLGTGNSSIGQLALYQKYHFRIIGIDTNFFTKYYTSNIFENGIQCMDMIRLSQDL
ncbi:MAG: hypothetical protein KC455_10775 [Carnobacterium sp.]|nr:hypothetical protein [Carnobacterium sp.]